MVFTTITVINQIWQLTSICANFLIRVETYKVEIRNSGKVHFLFFYAFFLKYTYGDMWECMEQLEGLLQQLGHN